MSTISEPFVRRPVLTVLMSISAIIFGVLAYMSLPVNDLPAVDYPVISVQAFYPGATPETMAANVATPLEKQFMQISGLDYITSSSSQGMCNLTLQFNLDKSIDAAATDVQTAISQASGSLPSNMPSAPTFSKNNPNDQPIMYIGLVSNSVTAGKLYDFASTNIGQRISILPGVARVVVYGTKSAIRVKADPSALASRGLSMDDLSRAIQGGTANLGAGQFDGPTRTFLLQPNGQLVTAEDYNNLIIGKGKVDGMPIYLKDVAQALDTVQDERVKMRFWVRGYGVPSATAVVAVFRQSGTNAVDVAQRVAGLSDQIKRELPGSMLLIPIYDRSKSIVNSVNDVKETLYIAFGLVVLVIFIFLGRASDTLIPAISLPLSLLLTFIVMSMLHYSLDNLSLMALTLAIGFLVDDAIVFLENTVRRMEHGENAFNATLHSAKEISFTILAMTISLAAVFIPLVFMPGLIGRVFREFSITIIVAIFASGLVSLTLTPMMCSRMLGKRGKDVKKNLMERTFDSVEKPILRLYGKTLWFFIHNKVLSLAVWGLCLAGTIYFFRVMPQSFLPEGDSSFIDGVMIVQEGTSFTEMRKYQQQVEEILKKDDSVDMTFTMTGASILNSNMGFVLMFLKDFDKRPPMTLPMGDGKTITLPHTPIGALAGMTTMKLMGEVPGALTVLSPNPVLQISVGGASTSQGKYSFTISGVNPQEVYEAAGKMMPELSKFSGFQSVTQDYYNHTPVLGIELRRDQAKTYGVSERRILQLLSSAYSQNYVYLINQPTDQYQVILEARDKNRQHADDLQGLYITTDDGQRSIPLSALVKWKPSIGPLTVNHYNQFTSVTFNFNLRPGVAAGEAIDYIDKTYKQFAPPTIRGQMQGEGATFRETMASMPYLIGLAVFVMYVILGVLYESYLHPLTVLSSLPVALVGGLATLYGYGLLIQHFTGTFGAEMSLYAYIGIFMLMGIVKKNGIMVVDFAQQRIAHGLSAQDAIHEASMDRFRPIMMTSLAALMGALPIALGHGSDGSSRQPLGLVIVGGLIFAQFITLYITPAIYLTFEMLQEKVLDRTTFFRASHHQHGGDETTIEVDKPTQGLATDKPLA